MQNSLVKHTYTHKIFIKRLLPCRPIVKSIVWVFSLQSSAEIFYFTKTGIDLHKDKHNMKHLRQKGVKVFSLFLSSCMSVLEQYLIIISQNILSNWWWNTSNMLSQSWIKCWKDLDCFSFFYVIFILLWIFVCVMRFIIN